MIWEIEFLGRNYYITNKIKPLIDMKTKIFVLPSFSGHENFFLEINN